MASIFCDWRSCSSRTRAIGDVGDRALDDDVARALVGEQGRVLEGPHRAAVLALSAQLDVGEGAELEEGLPELLAHRLVRMELGHVAADQLLAGGVAEDVRHGVVALEDPPGQRDTIDAGHVALEEEPVPLLGLADGFLGALALDRDGDLLRNEGQDVLLRPAVPEARVVALDDEHPEGAPAGLQGHAEPVDGRGAHRLDLARRDHRREIFVGHEQGLARVQDVFGQALAEGAREPAADRTRRRSRGRRASRRSGSDSNCRERRRSSWRTSARRRCRGWRRRTRRGPRPRSPWRRSHTGRPAPFRRACAPRCPSRCPVRGGASPRGGAPGAPRTG